MILRSPDELLQWDEAGIRLHLGSAGSRGRQSLGWDQVRSVCAADPWPEVRIVPARAAMDPSPLTVRAVLRVGTEHPYDLADHLERFLAAARQRRLWVPGWDRLPATFWGRAPRWPEGRLAAPPGGAFRTAAAPGDDDVVFADPLPRRPLAVGVPDGGRWHLPLRRAAAPVALGAGGLALALAQPDATGVFVAAIAGTAAAAIRPQEWTRWVARADVPRTIDDADVAVTGRWVYARRRDRSCWRLPRNALRLEIVSRATHQSRFVFDRFAELRVGHHRARLVDWLRRELETRRGR